MSVAYTNYISTFKKLYMASTGKKPKTESDCLRFLESVTPRLKQSAIEKNAPCIYQQIAMDSLLHYYWYHTKNTNHYFLDAGLAAFLIKSVKDFTEEYFVKESFGIKSELSDKMSCFFIHLPTKEWNNSIGVLTCPTVFNPVKGGREKYLFYATDFENIAFESIRFEREKLRDELLEGKYAGDEDTNNMQKLVFGLSLYISAFPDVICSADNVMHVGHYKGSRHYIRANDIVSTEVRHGVSPHFRRGHFRVLRSDHFKAARGKTIFINGMFVKGKAFDVLADDCKGGAI